MSWQARAEFEREMGEYYRAAGLDGKAQRAETLAREIEEDAQATGDEPELEAGMSIAWQKVYGDDAEERIWDGRGLSTNDVKPEHIRPGPGGYGPFICKAEQAPEHDKEAGG